MSYSLIYLAWILKICKFKTKHLNFTTYLQKDTVNICSSLQMMISHIMYKQSWKFIQVDFLCLLHYIFKKTFSKISYCAMIVSMYVSKKENKYCHTCQETNSSTEDIHFEWKALHLRYIYRVVDTRQSCTQCFFFGCM